MAAVTVEPGQLRTIVADLRCMTGGFANELAVAWPVLPVGIGEPVISAVGTEQHVRVLPERVFRYALRVGAVGVVLAHNHPTSSGPSRADEAVTRRLVAAGHVLGIPLVAHLVVEPVAVYELVGRASVSFRGSAAS